MKEKTTKIVVEKISEQIGRGNKCNSGRIMSKKK